MNPTSLNNPHRERLARLFFLLLMGGIALLVFGPAGDDDGHITYTAAKHFAESGRVSNHNGEWVEQGSSLLHVLSLGALLWLLGLVSNAVEVAAIGPIYSLFFALLCLPLTITLAQRLRLRQPLHAGMLLSVSTAITYWASGGLEATLAASCFLYFLFAVFQFIRHHPPHYLDGHLLLATAMFLLVRPESFFVLVLFLALFTGLLWMQGKQAMFGRIGIMAAYALTLFAIICAVRLYFYGQVFPQPVYAKAAGLSPLKIAFGLYYFIYSAQLSIIAYTVLLWGIFRQRLLVSPQMLAAFSLCVAYLAFIVASGGDWMAGGRFFVPVLPVMIVLALYALQRHRHYRKILAALVALCLFEITAFSFKLAAGLPPYQVQAFRNSYPDINWRGYAWTETDNLVHARDIPVINALNDIIDALPEQQKPHVIASIQMGMVPFHLRQRYADKVYIVDMRGLSTRHLSDCPQLAAAPKTWSGIAISYHDYFAAMAQCQLPEPDIIYDLLNREPEVNADRLDSIQRQGYTIVYRQRGRFMPAHGLKSVDADTFIAVSPALYSLLPEALRMRHPYFGQDSVSP